MTASNMSHQTGLRQLDTVITRGLCVECWCVVIFTIIPCAQRISCAVGLIRLLLQKTCLRGVSVAPRRDWPGLRCPPSWTFSPHWHSCPSTCSTPQWPGGGEHQEKFSRKLTDVRGFLQHMMTSAFNSMVSRCCSATSGMFFLTPVKEVQG